MDQSQTDQPAPQPKKHRMTFAEWRKANPNPTSTPEEEKKIAEMQEGIMELVAEWYRNNMATAHRKTRQANSDMANRSTRPS